jgi:hypothetical protein
MTRENDWYAATFWNEVCQHAIISLFLSALVEIVIDSVSLLDIIRRESWLFEGLLLEGKRWRCGDIVRYSL